MGEVGGRQRIERGGKGGVLGLIGAQRDGEGEQLMTDLVVEKFHHHFPLIRGQVAGE